MEQYDVVARLFRKGELGKTCHTAINWQAFMNMIHTPEVQKDLREGKLVGLLTHEAREVCRRSKLPHEDIAAKSPDALWTLKGVWELGDSIYGGLNWIHGPAAERAKELYNSGTKLYVSISTELNEVDGQYVIIKLHGVDLTLKPEFPNSEVTDLHFDFSEGGNTSKICDIVGDAVDFSLKEYIRERITYKPHIFFHNRILEVIRYLKFTPTRRLAPKDYFKRYITEYLLEWVQKAYKDPNSDLNILVALRLNEYLKDLKPARLLQRFLTQARREVLSSKAISKITQEAINQYYRQVCDGIMQYVDSRVGIPEKALSSVQVASEE